MIELSKIPSFVIIIVVCMVSIINVCILLKINLLLDGKNDNENITQMDNSISASHRHIADQFYYNRKFKHFSKLGDILYKHVEYPKISRKNQTYRILIWKNWKYLQQRHVYFFGKVEHDPLSKCSVKNCQFTGNNDKLRSADAVVVHLQLGQIPTPRYRNRSQIWIFLNDESPRNVFNLDQKTIPIMTLHNVFNWSMTYMSNSDIPVPYGRTVPLKNTTISTGLPLTELIPNWKTKRRDVLATVLISNCAPSYRMGLISSLRELMNVDVYGRCGTDELRHSCPGHHTKDCKVISHYLFYLVFENSKCIEYMTEKLFYNAYSKGAIPIIQGPSLEDCRAFLPPNSYLHVDNYPNLVDLVEDVKKISNNKSELLFFHQWRFHFEVLNEHGYFGTRSFHLCRICEAMNLNDRRENVYSEQMINQYLNASLLCRG